MHYYICQDTLYHSQPFSSEEEMINQLRIDYKLYILFEYIPKQVDFKSFIKGYRIGKKVTKGIMFHNISEKYYRKVMSS